MATIFQCRDEKCGGQKEARLGTKAIDVISKALEDVNKGDVKKAAKQIIELGYQSSTKDELIGTGPPYVSHESTQGGTFDNV